MQQRNLMLNDCFSVCVCVCMFIALVYTHLSPVTTAIAVHTWQAS